MRTPGASLTRSNCDGAEPMRLGVWPGFCCCCCCCCWPIACCCRARWSSCWLAWDWSELKEFSQLVGSAPPPPAAAPPTLFVLPPSALEMAALLRLKPCMPCCCWVWSTPPVMPLRAAGLTLPPLFGSW